MSSKKVSELNSLSVFSDTAYVPVVDGGVTYKMSLEDLLQKTIRIDKSSELSEVATKTVITNTDLLMVDDAASSNAKKKCPKQHFFTMCRRCNQEAEVFIGPSKKECLYYHDPMISICSITHQRWQQFFI